jgi:hypothetical protein
MTRRIASSDSDFCKVVNTVDDSELKNVVANKNKVRNCNGYGGLNLFTVNPISRNRFIIGFSSNGVLAWTT